MRKYGPSLLQSFSQGPALVSQDHLAALRVLGEGQNEGMMASMTRAIASGLGISVKQAREEGIKAQEDLCAAMGVEITDRSKPFIFSDGVAVIPVWGALLHRDNWCDSYATGYDYIRARYQAALNDPEVKGIVFDVNSPGGHVAGNFELADDIYKGRSVKPSLSIIDVSCYSGGYSLGSSMSRMVATPSGGVGSIGVVMMHVSIEKMLKEAGVDVTFIYAGQHKVDGNMFEKLPADVRKRYEASIERTYEKFVSLVARNRGMDADAVRATEAACYDVEEALSLGLIDAIQTPKEALAAFRKELSGSTTNPNQGATTMSTPNENTGAGGAAVATPAAAPVVATPAAVPTVEAPVADTPAVAAAPSADAVQAAVEQDRQRISAIQGCDEAKGCEALANHLALNTSMSVDDAKRTLGAAPRGTSANSFVAVMNNSEQPNITADAGSGDGPAELSVAKRIAGNYRVATGGAFQKPTA